MKNFTKTLLILSFIALFVANCKKKDTLDPEPTSVTDIDGNVYKIVKIGTQYWMAENLKTMRYRNGDSIPTTYPANLQISPSFTIKYQWITGLNSKYLAKFGRVYTQGAVEDARGLAPKGWHIPSVAEFQQLIDFVGGNADEVEYKLMDKDTSFWAQTPTSNLITNASGFSARGGGSRYGNGEYAGIRTTTQFATKGAVPGNVTKGLALDVYNSVQVGDFGLLLGWSPGTAIHVRCIKD